MLGIIEELEEACALREGELCVSWLNFDRQQLGASRVVGGPACEVGPIEEFSHRYCGPWAPRRFWIGDIVVRLPT